ncbi:ABC transporter permease [Allorhizocola rhizosphaerae]|uniref:ABC transporter permease n=1 Tax=Allorhizocola rhizosphaerae TaxID=1872709 RepID=UPI000E3C97AC|nr:ABC transporter permease [Allorhizocola rhizosphaerae]
MRHIAGHALSELRAHPWRAALSGLSLMVGALAIVAINMLSLITAEVFIAAAEQQDGRAATFGARLQLGVTQPDQLRAALLATTPVTVGGGAAAIVAEPSIRTGAGRPEDPIGTPLSFQEMRLIAGELSRVKRLPVLQGRWLAEDSAGAVELLFNQAAVRRWGGVGTVLRLKVTNDQPAITAAGVGIIADGGGDPRIYASLPALLRLRPAVLADTEVRLLIHHPTADIGTLTGIANRVALAAGGRLDGNLVRADQTAYLLEQLKSQRLAFSAVAAVALAIAALGILNIGLASIGERTRELVVRRAVGATRTAIVGQILLAAIAVGLISAAGAIGLAIVGAQWWVPTQIDPATAIEPPGVPWFAVATGVLATTAATLAGSIIPAVVAARLDVATALRD